MKKKPKEKKIDVAIGKAIYALRGMLHIPTAEAIKYYLLNPKSTPNKGKRI